MVLGLLSSGLVFSMPSVARVSHPNLELWVAGDSEAVGQAEQSTSEFLSKLGCSVTVRRWTRPQTSPRCETTSEFALRAYLDLGSSAGPSLLLCEGATGAELSRRALPAADSLELSVEASAYVLSMLVQAYLRTTAADAEASRPSPTAAAPALNLQHVRGVESSRRAGTSSAEPSQFGLNLTAAGVGLLLSAGRVLTGVSAGFEAGSHGSGTLPGVRLAATYYLPAELGMGNLRAKLQLISLRLVPTLERELSSSLSVWGGLGGGLDSVSVSAEETPESVNGGRDTRLEPVLSGLLGLRLRLASSSQLLFGIGGELDLSRGRYLAVDASGDRVFFESRRVRPQLFAGLSFALTGAHHFSKVPLDASP